MCRPEARLAHAEQSGHDDQAEKLRQIQDVIIAQIQGDTPPEIPAAFTNGQYAGQSRPRQLMAARSDPISGPIPRGSGYASGSGSDSRSGRFGRSAPADQVRGERQTSGDRAGVSSAARQTVMNRHETSLQRTRGGFRVWIVEAEPMTADGDDSCCGHQLSETVANVALGHRWLVRTPKSPVPGQTASMMSSRRKRRLQRHRASGANGTGPSDKGDRSSGPSTPYACSLPGSCPNHPSWEIKTKGVGRVGADK